MILEHDRVTQDRTRGGIECAHWGRVGRSCPACGVMPSMGTSVDDDSALVTVLLVAAFCLNVIDAILTLVGIRLGLVQEMNPLLIGVVSSPVLFLAIKLGAVGGFTMCLWRLRRHAWVLYGAYVAFFAYLAIVCYHIYGLMGLYQAVH